ncbi:MAG: hypothetical protein R2932_49075 [Caldilineaceae bacterium]
MIDRTALTIATIHPNNFIAVKVAAIHIVLGAFVVGDDNLNAPPPRTA